MRKLWRIIRFTLKYTVLPLAFVVACVLFHAQFILTDDELDPRFNKIFVETNIPIEQNGFRKLKELEDIKLNMSDADREAIKCPERDDLIKDRVLVKEMREKPIKSWIELTKQDYSCMPSKKIAEILAANDALLNKYYELLDEKTFVQDANFLNPGGKNLIEVNTRLLPLLYIEKARKGDYSSAIDLWAKNNELLHRMASGKIDIVRTSIIFTAHRMAKESLLEILPLRDGKDLSKILSKADMEKISKTLSSKLVSKDGGWKITDTMVATYFELRKYEKNADEIYLSSMFYGEPFAYDVPINWSKFFYSNKVSNSVLEIYRASDKLQQIAVNDINNFDAERQKIAVYSDYEDHYFSMAYLFINAVFAYELLPTDLAIRKLNDLFLADTLLAVALNYDLNAAELLKHVEKEYGAGK